MLTIRAMSDGKDYSARHLEHNDYYAENERVTGYWYGRSAELLGLSGEVRHEHFEALRQALHPETGEFLRQRHSVDRVDENGEATSHARSLYDLTFSAPKSVSIMAVLAEDHRLREAHEIAVTEALKEAESFAAARVRQGGANEDRLTSNLAIAVYQHDTSRELDPQLHAHAVAANLTYLRVRYANVATRSSHSEIRKAAISGSRYAEFLQIYCRNSACAASNGTRPSRDLRVKTDVHQQTTKSPFWCAKRESTNLLRSLRINCGLNKCGDLHRARAKP